MVLRLFPTLAGATYPVMKSPTWATDVQRSISGKVSTLARWSYPIYKFELPFSFLRVGSTFPEYETLMAFYNSAQGRANLFRFNDPDDNTVTANTFGTGDGTTTEFQLLRTITGTGVNWNDPVFYPVTAEIYVNGVLKTDGVDYTIDDYGLVTFAVAPAAAAALTWTGTFDWLVRFSEDAVTFEQFVRRIYEMKSITFATEKLP